MSDSDEESPDEKINFDSRTFFDRNSSLFTVLGVFGAISVYITQLNIPSQWQRLGLVSSLSIFLLVAVNIYQGFVPNRSDKNPFDFLMQPRRDRFKLVLFAVPFFGIIATVTAVVVSYMGTINFLLQFVFAVLGTSSTYWIVGQLESPEDFKPTLGEDHELVVYMAHIARNAAYGFIIGLGYLSIAFLQGWVSYESIQLLRSTSIVISVTSGYAAGLVLGGTLYFLIVFSVLFVHWLVLSKKKRGEWEEFAEFYNSWIGNEQASEE